MGNPSVTSIGGTVGWSTLSDGRFKKNIETDVPGLSFIRMLRPVTYNLDVAGINAKSDNIKGKKRPDGIAITQDPGTAAEERKAMEVKSKTKYTGFIAQEVEAAAKSLNYDFSGVDAPKNDKDFYGLRYAEFVVPLVKSVQELEKQNEELKNANKDLLNRIERLEKMVIAPTAVPGTNR